MEPFTVSLVLLPIILIILYLKLGKNPSTLTLPPGPKTWPIIGNIHQLSNKPHCSVTELSRTYGSIMSLKLGTMTTIVISSPDMAKEMYLKHDLAFAGRNPPDGARVANHHKHSVVWLSVCPKWRHFRKIATVQLFTNHRLNASAVLRQRKVAELMDHVQHCCEKGGHPVDIGQATFTTALNLLSNTFFSADLGSHDSSHLQEFKDIVRHVSELGGRPNISDFFPLVRCLDLQGVSRMAKGHFDKILAVFEKIISRRLSDPLSAKYDDVLGTLLKMVEENELSLNDVKHFLVDLFLAGIDSTSSTLEWALTELLHNPEKMAKAQDELDQVFGKNDAPIQESDIPTLPYIQAVVKETLRLHPPAPLLPHKAEKDVQLCGYFVPKDANIWVNVWSIGRDPNVWLDALSFSPERFLGSEVDVKGRNFELIPFGAGRRMCPAMPLAYQMVNVMLANLIYSFNWKHANGLSPEEIDMEEKFGITLQKLQPLQAVPSAR